MNQLGLALSGNCYQEHTCMSIRLERRRSLFIQKVTAIILANSIYYENLLLSAVKWGWWISNEIIIEINVLIIWVYWFPSSNACLTRAAAADHAHHLVITWSICDCLKQLNLKPCWSQVVKLRYERYNGKYSFILVSLV